MIISKTPLRISFVGGGSDLQSFYERSDEGGAVITTAIDKHIYISVNKKFDNNIRLSYSKTEEVEDASDLEHPIVREVLRMLNLYGLEIVSTADIPSGTGLGSSSAFTVGLLRALYAYQQKHISAAELASKACEIEIDLLREPIGKQDQYGTAIGGLKMIKFHPGGEVSVDPIMCLRETRNAIEKNMMLLYTGLTRKASSVLAVQKTNMETDSNKVELMKKMVRLTHDLHAELQKDNHESFGDILHTNWMYKKEMSSVSNPQIDAWYEMARKNGAQGGKVLGAGGGGFILLYAPQEKHEAIKRALPELRRVNFQFENQGSQIVFIH